MDSAGGSTDRPSLSGGQLRAFGVPEGDISTEEEKTPPPSPDEALADDRRSEDPWSGGFSTALDRPLAWHERHLDDQHAHLVVAAALLHEAGGDGMGLPPSTNEPSTPSSSDDDYEAGLETATDSDDEDNASFSRESWHESFPMVTAKRIRAWKLIANQRKKEIQRERREQWRQVCVDVRQALRHEEAAVRMREIIDSYNQSFTRPHTA